MTDFVAAMVAETPLAVARAWMAVCAASGMVENSAVVVLGSVASAPVISTVTLVVVPEVVKLVV